MYDIIYCWWIGRSVYIPMYLYVCNCVLMSWCAVFLHLLIPPVSFFCRINASTSWLPRSLKCFRNCPINTKHFITHHYPCCIICCLSSYWCFIITTYLPYRPAPADQQLTFQRKPGSSYVILLLNIGKWKRIYLHILILYIFVIYKKKKLFAYRQPFA